MNWPLPFLPAREKKCTIQKSKSDKQMSRSIGTLMTIQIQGETPECSFWLFFLSTVVVVVFLWGGGAVSYVTMY